MKKNSASAFFIISFLLSGLAPAAQEVNTAGAARLLTTFKFQQFNGGVMILNARVNEYKDTLNFILDTGSGGISLDSTTVVELNIPTEPSSRTIRGIAGIRQVNFLYNATLHLPGLNVDSLNFHVNDYSALSSVYGERVDGIIGYSILIRYIVKINYDSLQLDICSKGSIRYPSGGYLIRPILNTLPIQTARVKDEYTYNSRFLHDIGAGVCLMLSKDFVEDSALIRKKRKLYPKEGEGIGGKVSMHLTVIKELKIGPYKFRNIPTYIFQDDYNVTSYPFLGGLIGNDIFRRFNVIFNYAKRDIHLLPNTHFREPFDYSYSGIELYYIDNKIVIGDVAAGSPAEQAGILEGDEVIGMNNNFSKNFGQYKMALQATGQKAKLVLNRNGELLQIEFKVKSIF